MNIPKMRRERAAARKFLRVNLSYLYNSLPYIIIIGGALRAIGLAASPLWYDETVSLYMARLPLADMVRAQSLDFSPPLWELIAWVSVRLFGANEWGMRLPSLAASLLSLWLANKIAYSLTLNFGPSQRFAGMSLVALLPYQFYAAQDGRIYAVMSALYLGAVLFALRRRPLGLAACCGLLLWSHSTGAFYAATALSVALARWPQLWRRWCTCGLTAAAAFAPWLPSLVGAGQRHHWLGALTADIFTGGLVRIFFADSMPGPAWMLPAVLGVAASVIVAALVAIRHIRLYPGLAHLGLAAAGPFVLMVAVAPIKNVLFYRPMSAMSIPLALWIGMALPLAWKPIRYALGYNWIMLIAAGLIAWTPAGKGNDLRALAAVMNEPGAVVYHATATSLLPLSLLLPEQEHVLLDESQHSGLLSDDLRDVFGLRRAPLETLGPGPVYVVWARDELVSDDANARMAAYVRGGMLIGTVRYWQAAPIEIYALP